MTRSPSKWMAPLSGWWAPDSILMRVDFPAPFSPHRQCTSPGRRSKEMPCSAWTPTKDLETSSRRRMAFIGLSRWVGRVPVAGRQRAGAASSAVATFSQRSLFAEWSTASVT